MRAGLPPQSVVAVTGLQRTPRSARRSQAGVLDRRPMFDSDHPRRRDLGRRYDLNRADVILWATGFRAALDHLAPLRLRGPGGGIAMDGTRVVADPRVHLVGYGPCASTIGANRAGRAAVAAILKLPGQSGGPHKLAQPDCPSVHAPKQNTQSTRTAGTTGSRTS